jgi:hypothetical protein
MAFYIEINTLNRCTVAYFYEKRHDSYPKEWEVANFHEQVSDAYAYV